MAVTVGLILVAVVATLGVWIMAKLAEVNAALDGLEQAVNALPGRLPSPGAASEADLDGVKARIDAATSALNGIAPPA